MIKKIWNNAVWSQIISASIIGLCLWGYGLIPKISLPEVWHSLYQTIISIAYLALAIALILPFRKYIKGARKNPTYKLDKFGPNNTIWSWDLLRNKTNDAWMIMNLTPHCKFCSTKTVIKENYGMTTVYCSKCDLDGKRTDNSLKESCESVYSAIIRRHNEGEPKQMN